jgi:hypothetical protein
LYNDDVKPRTLKVRGLMPSLPGPRPKPSLDLSWQSTVKHTFTSKASAQLTSTFSLSQSISFVLDIGGINMGSKTELQMSTSQTSVQETSDTFSLQQEVDALLEPKERVCVVVDQRTTVWTADFQQRVCITEKLWCHWNDAVEGHNWWVVNGLPPDALCGVLAGRFQAEVLTSNGQFGIKAGACSDLAVALVAVPTPRNVTVTLAPGARTGYLRTQ